jgi:hypothetical protein
MPNWVFNKLEIRGDEQTLDRLSRTVQSVPADTEQHSPFSFQQIIARPADQEEDWYNWNIQNWGVKWDASDVETMREPGKLSYRLSTPWSAPFPVLKSLSEQFASVCITHTYEEEQGWGGVMEFNNGVHTEKDSWDIPDSHAEIIRRGGDCYCEDEAYYNDCYSERARNHPDLDTRTREAAVALGVGWSGSYDELIAAASRL